MYDRLTSFVLGYHGCDETVAESVFAGTSTLRPSENEYDWLGHGIYFWEQSPQRALEYAQSLQHHPERLKHGRVVKPAVVGAVIDLALCLNLLDARYLAVVKDTYDDMKRSFDAAGTPLPRNKSIGKDELLLRPLDCAVIEAIHNTREDQHLPAFDSVRGMFTEGEPLYEGAGFHARNHIQICVRNHRCIKGYFRVMTESA